jgi:hypothetical protein
MNTDETPIFDLKSLSVSLRMIRVNPWPKSSVNFLTGYMSILY